MNHFYNFDENNFMIKEQCNNEETKDFNDIDFSVVLKK